MNYYKIAPLRLNLPPLIYKSKSLLQKNSVVKIRIKHRDALGIVVDSATKPNFECEEARKSECYLTQNQAILGRFIANYYCVNLGVAFGIMALGAVGCADSAIDSVDSKSADSVRDSVDSADSVSVDSKSADSADKKSQNLTKSPIISTLISALPKLSESQQNALNFILSNKKTLLFGDTGSGKTEIYINAIAQVIAQGKNVIFLMPEISLTPQMERRLKGVFGDLVCIWHSKISKAKKDGILANLDGADSADSAMDSADFVRDSATDSTDFTQDSTQDSTRDSTDSTQDSTIPPQRKKTPIKIIAGARSALFLPLKNLGLIIVDEEHDEAYKSTSAPRYNARDLAIFLAQKQGIRLILGSATPSVNTYYNFGLKNHIFRLRGGYFQGKKRISFDSEILSPNLLQKIDFALKNKQQIIVFVPLRGNFKVLQCVNCGWGIKCENCAVNMSLHSKRNALICHYCGFAKPFFDTKTKCQNCNFSEFSALKIGTQEICKQLQNHFAHAKIAIFDRDEVKSDSKMRRILGEFNDGKIDILVGTQMISKGHDYHNVALVAILGIDGVLNSSDFRAYERSVSLLTQISGRTARKNDGEVVINTRHREFFTPFLSDYEEFLRFELTKRASLYPPFCRLALLIAQSRDEGVAQGILQNAKKIVESAHKKVEIIGLNKAPIERINGLWRYFLLLRAQSAKELLGALVLCKDLPLIIDIDPQQVF